MNTQTCSYTWHKKTQKMFFRLAHWHTVHVPLLPWQRLLSKTSLTRATEGTGKTEIPSDLLKQKLFLLLLRGKAGKDNPVVCAIHRADSKFAVLFSFSFQEKKNSQFKRSPARLRVYRVFHCSSKSTLEEMKCTSAGLSLSTWIIYKQYLGILVFITIIMFFIVSLEWCYRKNSFSFKGGEWKPSGVLKVTFCQVLWTHFRDPTNTHLCT